jgi:protein-L-isoaspartate(D-aspartate) O-methyltransferase
MKFRNADLGSKRRELVENLKRKGYVHSSEVESAFLKVERENFVVEDQRKYSYIDSPLPILHGQTISAPSMIAIMLECAEFERGQKVLEIGTGSGYNAALIAEMVGPENVVTIERNSALAKFGGDNLKAAGYGVKVVIGDGSLGYPDDMPYERIFATAGAPRIPKPWTEQTRMGGRIIAPIGPGTFSQRLFIAEKVGEDELNVKKDTYCAFVPLVGREAWKPDEDDEDVW